MPTMLLAAIAALTFLIVPSPAQAQKIKGMTFVALDVSSLCTDCSVVQASGEFTDDTIKAYYDFIWRGRFKKNIYFIFDSPGGSLHEALRLGEIMRTLKVNTIVGRAYLRNGEVEIEPGRCASACVFAFIGGVTRSMPEKSTLGVHSWMPAVVLPQEGRKSKEKPKLLSQEIVERLHRQTASCLKYIDAMGVDLRLSVLILQTPYNRISWVSSRDQKLWSLVTIDSSLNTRAGRRWPVLFLPRPTDPVPLPAGQADARPLNHNGASL